LIRRLHSIFTGVRIQNKLLFSYLLVILIPLVILGGILYFSTISLTTKQTQENRFLEMKVLSQTLQEYFSSLELYSRAIYTGEIQQLLNNGQPQEIIEQTRWKTSLFQRFEEWYGYMGVQAQIHNVTLVLPSGAMIEKEPLYAGESFADKPWYQRSMSLQGEVYVAGPFKRSYMHPTVNNPAYTFSIVRKINNTLGDTELGGLVIDIHVMDISRLLNDIELSNIIILNADNQIVFSSASDRIGLPFNYGKEITDDTSEWMDIDGERMLVSSIYSEATSWRFVTLDPIDRIQNNSNAYRNLTIGIGFLALIIALLISNYVSRRITKPLRTLQHNMKQVQTGNFNIQLDVQSLDEVGQLTQSFNKMTDEIHKLVNDVYKSEITRKEAQLKALHSQINPHFLYNTLDSMNAIAVIEEVPLLARMAKMLSEMFRYSISAGAQIIELKEELKQIIRYVEIQQIRYDDKFSLQLSIPDHFLSYRIPKLTLQPIVENAIYHGLEMIPEAGRIEISCYETRDYTIIEVSDNGIGIAEEKLANIQKHLLEYANYTDHIGLANVRERIELHFGTKYGITLHSELGKGTTVTFRLPLESYKP
jgi:two-component system sensor histidine kinase YesM